MTGADGDTRDHQVGAEQPEEHSAEREPGHPETPPLLRIVRGNPTPDEVAALVTVLAAVSTSAADPPRRRPRAWSARHRVMTRNLPHGPGGWRSSALPR